MRYHSLRTLALAVGISLAAVAISASAKAASLRQGATGSSGEVTGSLPGEVLWTYYQTADVFNLNYSTSLNPYTSVFFVPNRKIIISVLVTDPGVVPVGNCSASIIPFETTVSCPADNILRLTNPNGAANTNLAGAKPETVCAMIYVFDDDQEMGECCGCPLTSTQLATFSVEGNLTSNWGLAGGAAADNTTGAIAIVAAAPNGLGGTCNPTNVPGYSVTNASNLLGSITNNQTTFTAREGATLTSVSDGNTQNYFVNSTPSVYTISKPAITEIPLSDDAGGDPTNLIYLQEQCGAIVGNGTGGGICNCPTEG
jgi:hypothetical protein